MQDNQMLISFTAVIKEIKTIIYMFYKAHKVASIKGL